jgi:hypothetical protein
LFILPIDTFLDFRLGVFGTECSDDIIAFDGDFLSGGGVFSFVVFCILVKLYTGCKAFLLLDGTGLEIGDEVYSVVDCWVD